MDMKISIIAVVYLGVQCLPGMGDAADVDSSFENVVLNRIAFSGAVNDIGTVDGIAADCHIARRVNPGVAKPDPPMCIIFRTLIMIDLIADDLTALQTYQIDSGPVITDDIIGKGDIRRDTV